MRNAPRLLRNGMTSAGMREKRNEKSPAAKRGFLVYVKSGETLSCLPVGAPGRLELPAISELVNRCRGFRLCIQQILALLSTGLLKNFFIRFWKELSKLLHSFDKFFLIEHADEFS